MDSPITLYTRTCKLSMNFWHHPLMFIDCLVKSMQVDFAPYNKALELLFPSELPRELKLKSSH